MAPLAIVPSLGANSPEREVVGKTGTSTATSFDGELTRQLQGRSASASPPLGRARASVPRDEATPTRTPLTGGEAGSALSKAWQVVTGQAPNPKLLSVLVGQWAHETGRGESMLNYNFGGLKGTSPSGMFAAYRTHEGSGETARVTTDRFRAYRSATEGAVDYVRFLRARFPSALDAASSGDASGFVHELKRGGYFTDNEVDYARSVTNLAQRAERDGFESIGATSNRTGPVSGRPMTFASLANQAANGLVIAPATVAGGGSSPFVDSSALANEIAQAAMRIAHSTPEDYLHEIERFDTPRPKA